MVNLEDLTKPQLIKIIEAYNKEVKIAYTNKTKQELIEIIKYFMNVYEGYIETKPKKIVMEKKKPKKVKDPLKELIGQRGLLRGEIDRYKTELEDMKVELEYDKKLKNDKKFVEKYKQKVNDANKLIIQLKEVNKQISKLEPSKAKAPERNLKKELEKLLSKSKQQEERDIKQNKEFEEIEKQFKEASKPKAKPKAPKRNLKKELEELLKKTKLQDERDIKQKKEFEEIEKQFKQASKAKQKEILKELQIYMQSQPQRQKNKDRIDVSLNKSGTRIVINGEEYTKQNARDILAKYIDFPPNIIKKTYKEIVDYFNLNYDNEDDDMTENQKFAYDFFRGLYSDLEYLNQINEEYENLEEEDEKMLDIIEELEAKLPTEVKLSLQDIKQVIKKYEVKIVHVIILNSLLIDSKSDVSIINDKLIENIKKLVNNNKDMLIKFSESAEMAKLMQGIGYFENWIEELEDKGDNDDADEARLFVNEYNNLSQKIRR